MSESIPHVIVEHDWLDYTNFVLGMAVAAIAVVALLVALLARRDVDRDRRQVFELGVLKEIATAWARSTDVHGDPDFVRLVSFVPGAHVARMDR
jgi:hypothetical protein